VARQRVGVDPKVTGRAKARFSRAGLITLVRAGSRDTHEAHFYDVTILCPAQRLVSATSDRERLDALPRPSSAR
jgi:hypothetical protein